MGSTESTTIWARIIPSRAVISPIEMLGAAVAIGGLLYLHGMAMRVMDAPLFVAPLAASIAIIFVQPGMTVARSWNVIGGQAIAAAIGLTTAAMLGGQLELAGAVALGLALLVMRACRCLHPPACATALIIVVTPAAQHTEYLVFPVVTGAILIVLWAWVVHVVEARIPRRWGGRTTPHHGEP
ncbi:MAG: HPP family protein [Gaiellales bacterium]